MCAVNGGGDDDRAHRWLRVLGDSELRLEKHGEIELPGKGLEPVQSWGRVLSR